MERAQNGHMSIGLLRPFDDGQGDTLKRFEQTLGCGTGGFASWIAGLQPGQFGPLSFQLTAYDTFQERQHP